MKNKHKNEQAKISLEAIAEQWVNLLFVHLQHNKNNKKQTKNKNNHGK